MRVRPIRLRVTRRRSAVAAGIVAALGAVALVVLRLPWTMNVSESLPIGIYRTEPVNGPLRRGDRVVVCPPLAVVGILLERRYISRGNCPGGTVAMMKIVGGIAGDAVEVRMNGVYIDGRRLPHSGLYEVDSAGRPLPVQPVGTRVVPAGQVWLWTPNPISFDSRYFGFVSVSSVRSRAHLILPFGPWAFSADLPPEPL